jgi:hypothetical protein
MKVCPSAGRYSPRRVFGFGRRRCGGLPVQFYLVPHTPIDGGIRGFSGCTLCFADNRSGLIRGGRLVFVSRKGVQQISAGMRLRIAEDLNRGDSEQQTMAKRGDNDGEAQVQRWQSAGKGGGTALSCIWKLFPSEAVRLLTAYGNNFPRKEPKGAAISKSHDFRVVQPNRKH